MWDGGACVGGCGFGMGFVWADFGVVGDMCISPLQKIYYRLVSLEFFVYVCFHKDEVMGFGV